jgi:hypothetical protein
MLPVYAALLLVSGLSRAQEATPPVPSGSNAILQVDSTKPGVTVALIEGRSTGSGYVAGAGYATIYTTTYRDLCVTPCKVEVPAGMREYAFYGGGYTPASMKLDMKAGQTDKLTVEPGSYAAHTLSVWGGSLGLSAIIGGVLFYALDAGMSPRDRMMSTGVEAGIAGGGVVLTGLSIWGLKASATKVTQSGAPAVSMAYQGTF